MTPGDRPPERDYCRIRSNSSRLPRKATRGPQPFVTRCHGVCSPIVVTTPNSAHEIPEGRELSKRRPGRCIAPRRRRSGHPRLRTRAADARMTPASPPLAEVRSVSISRSWVAAGWRVRCRAHVRRRRGSRCHTCSMRWVPARLGGVGLSLDRVWPLPHRSGREAKDFHVALSTQLRKLLRVAPSSMLLIRGSRRRCGRTAHHAAPAELGSGAGVAPRVAQSCSGAGRMCGSARSRVTRFYPR